MRQHSMRTMEQYRMEHSGPFPTKHRSGVTGFYQAEILRIIASNGTNGDGQVEVPWDHVSVSTEHRCPTWEEMEWVREQFFKDDELVLQFSVPRDEEAVNHHPYCLHMWKHHDQVVVVPPPILVGPTDKHPLTPLEQDLIAMHGKRMRS